MNKAKYKILYYVIMTLCLLATLFLIYEMNKITNDNAFFSSIMPNMTGQIINQTIFIFALAFYGFVLLRCFSTYLKYSFAVLLALIVGTLTWSIVSQIIISVGIKFTALSVIVACLLVLAIVLITTKAKLTTIFSINDLYVGLAYLVLALFFSSLCVFRFSYDSFMYINTGEKLAKVGYLNIDLIKIVSGFSIFTSMLFAPSEFFNYDFSQGLYLFFNTSFVVCVSYFVYHELKDMISNKKAVIIGGFVFLSIIGANLFFEVMYWPLSNLLSATIMFMLIYFIYKSQKSENSLFGFYMSLFFAIGFVWLRSENSLLMLVLIFLITNLGYKKKHLVIYTLVSLATILLWYIRFFLVAGFSFNDGAFLTIGRALPILLAYVAMVIYIIFIKDAKWLSKLLSIMKIKNIEVLFFIIYILAIVGLSILDIERAIINLDTTVINMFRYGGWGGSMIIFSIFLIVYYSIRNKYDIWDKSLLGFILFYFLIFLLRDMPLRQGFGDSGNRYFVSVIPIISYMTSIELGKLLITGNNKYNS